MQKTEQRAFLGKTFTTVQLPAMTAMLLFRRVAGFLGPPLAALAGNAAAVKGKSVGDLLDDVSAAGNVGVAVKLLFDSLSEAELERLIRDLLAATTVDNAEVMAQFDLLFQGRIEEVFAVCRWVFEVNFGSFYAKAASAMRGLTVKQVMARTGTQPSASPVA